MPKNHDRNIDHWPQVTKLDSRDWICGHCGRETANNRGYRFGGNHDMVIYFCPGCIKPTYFEKDNQFPGASFGEMVDNLPDAIRPLYQEARNCMSVSASTAAVLLCRKILMHIAVENGAAVGLSFQAYVNHLVSVNVIPAQCKTWVDHIREKGNEANHELVLMARKDATNLITFTEMLLKIIYEYPNRAAEV